MKYEYKIQRTLTIQFLIVVFREAYNMEVFLEVVQMTYSYLSFEPALDRKQIFCIALKCYERYDYCLQEFQCIIETSNI